MVVYVIYNGFIYLFVSYEKLYGEKVVYGILV